MEFEYAIFSLKNEYDLDDIAFDGNCYIYQSYDGCFVSHEYVSPLLINPTWRDIMKLTDIQMKTTPQFK